MPNKYLRYKTLGMVVEVMCSSIFSNIGFHCVGGGGVPMVSPVSSRLGGTRFKTNYFPMTDSNLTTFKVILHCFDEYEL